MGAGRRQRELLPRRTRRRGQCQRAGSWASWLIAHMGQRPDVIRPELVRELTRKRVRTAREAPPQGLARPAVGRPLRAGLANLHRRRPRPDDAQRLGQGLSSPRSPIHPDHDTGLALLLNAESGAINDLSLHFWRRVFAEAPLIAAKERDITPDRRAKSAQTAAVATPD